MLKKPSVLYVVIAVVALSAGLLVYLLDRRPEHTYFLSHALISAAAPYSVFGVAGNYLPAFLHVYAFILLTVAVAGSASARLIGICTAWLVIASLFEFAQHPALSPLLAAATPAWFARVPVLDNVTAYFLNGTFDVLDLLSIMLGTVIAYLTVVITHKAFHATFEKGQNRVLRHGAITGVTVLGLLAIVASGDGDSTLDTMFTTEINAWEATAVSGAPTGRTKHTAVWTGSEMIVWGGQDSGGASNSGGRYDSVADTWVATSLSGAPAQRFGHTAIWDGAEMIVWGGVDGAPNYFLDGAVYDPGTNTWSATATPSGFLGRWDHTAVWTGAEMIVWGGRTSFGFSNTGAAYDPVVDTWRLLPSSPLTERAEHTAVWTGTEMIVWGGNTNLDPSNDGAAYNPTTNSWRPIAAPPAGFPVRANHTAVWTGTEMIVWGGATNVGVGVTNSGAAYDPATDSWRLIATSGAPVPRRDHTAVWTGPAGIAMVIWGGQDGFGIRLNDGGRYDPVTDSWKATDMTINEVPTGRFDHTAVWSGTKMIVWGGDDGTLTNTGGRYAP